MKRPTRIRLIAVGAALAVIVAGVLAAPRPPTLSTSATGDPGLAQSLADKAGIEPGARDTLVTAVIDAEGVAYAGLGADETTEFEIGSITKTFTALLLAQAVERGEVALTDPVGDYLDLGDSAAADVTLADLSSHRSGLPRIAITVSALATSLWSSYRGSDPYPFDLAALEEHARAAALTDPGTVAYSNLGVALLGQALAAAAGTDYPELLQTRVLEPLGMAHTSIAVTADALPAGARTGYTTAGRPADAWTMGAYAPAGAIRSTAADMALYAQALLSADPALGVDPATVLDPQGPAGAGPLIGLAWFTQAPEDGTATWHNGGTGGFASMLALDRTANRAVIVLGNTATSVDALAMSILEENK
ncbi:class A beta-lactamase-related serine hydrolase [Cryobacterium lactosi]|uniref:Class A beta-lactamase-related serine hydrolase n=1 Tax=Cryobacterium lactosi TaxID=1259202 RepID=A0A4R9BIH1_9MICO|nr:serine hydrolase domain-containing protein [Cryobacterium lactosi]TFD83934.1 class A beta-lactamase-related serine hydrolase [Cryobacterium lactosi]